MAFDFDIDPFFSDDAFGVSAIYTHSGTASTISVIFEDEPYEARGTGGEGIGMAAPFALCKTTDVPSAIAGDTLEIGDTTWYVIAPGSPLSDGTTRLYLSKDPI